MAFSNESVRTLLSRINLEDFNLDQIMSKMEEPGGISNPKPLVSGMPTVCPEGYKCVVCMEGFDDQEAQQGSENGGKQMPCGHVYHLACICNWVSLCNSCPLCRCPISPIPEA